MITSTSDMRVIGGIHRGRTLRTIGGLAVRPTSDRLRETLFNILAARIDGSRFLDICAGSGAVGIEALSRGASEATFVDSSRNACAVIEANLASLGMGQEATIITRDAAVSLKRLDRESRQFDIAFFDPPYASEIYPQVMKQLGLGNLLAREALVIVEYRAKTPPLPECGRLQVFREVKQGESALAFYEEVSSP
jgi:16S rRNA (guanine966-N2)-methyltransferase